MTNQQVECDRIAVGIDATTVLRGTILAVDDDQSLVVTLAGELEDCGYQVLCASSGHQALSLLRQRSLDINVLITDIRLKGDLDGWDVADEARTIKPGLPIIYVTGFFTKAYREVIGCVTVMKPYRTSTIVDQIRKLEMIATLKV